RARASIVRHCEAMVALQRLGSVVFDYGNNLRGQAQAAGFGDAFRYPGFVEAYVRPLFCEGKGPFRWVALSGEPGDITETDRAVLNTSAGATWVAVHHGGGVGIGYSIHAGQVVVADGTELGARKLERVLATDPGTGVVRHADAGYELAIAAAKRHGLRIPMLG